MTSFPRSPRLVRGGLVLVDPASSAVLRVIALQYNPDNLSRSFQIQSADASQGGRSDALRLKGPPVETLNLEAEIDATDQLEVAEETAVEVGIHPQLAALESIMYPPSDRLVQNDLRLGQGVLEVAPVQAPLTLFVWSENRIVPVRLTEFSVTEEAFDPNLNPIRAKVTLGMRVLSVDDLGFRHLGGSLYLSYQQHKERMATRDRDPGLGTLGIENLP